MLHAFPLIATVAAALGLAFVLGFLASRLKLPTIVGYLLAGILIGPHTPGFVADTALARQLAEIGVILLMFGIGLHFSVEDLLAVRRVAVPGAFVQIGVATIIGAVVGAFWGWNWSAGLVFGLALSVASTVVLLRALEDRELLETVNGRIAVGWLIVEDVAMVLILLCLPSLVHWQQGVPGGDSADGGGLLARLSLTLGAIAVFVVLMLVVGRRVFPWLLAQVARAGSRELFTLCVIAVAVAIAYGAAEVFGVSFALGAFFAGVVMSESDLSHRAAEESLPLRDAFAVLFFVSVGMLFDPTILLSEPIGVVVVLAVIMVVNPMVAFVFVAASRYPLNTALTVAAGVAQIGEFSFILVGLGVALNLLPIEGQQLVLAGALLSIALNPLLFYAIEPAQAWIKMHSSLALRLERRDDPLAELPPSVDDRRLTGHVVLVGYGRVGRRIAEALAARDIPMVVADQERERVEGLRDRGVAAVSGDASEAAVLIQSHVARARLLIVAIPDVFRARQMVEIARKLNPSIETMARSHSDEETEFLQHEGIGRVFMGEHELAQSMARHAIGLLTARPGARKRQDEGSGRPSR
ncbi:MAG: Kef family K(+) transporter [Alphaproteobacteria bacterium]|nr:Kef family K(+) transporter [Alphaproteobacteria bacterium]